VKSASPDETEQSVIRTALKTSAIAATIAGATFMASPAHAGVENEGSAYGNNVNVTIIGGYGVTCASVAVAGNSGANCNHNKIANIGNSDAVGNGSGNR
jgi:hypothetical protein